MAEPIRDIEDVIERLGRLGYVADRALGTAIYLLVKLGKPLLIEGHAGVGKTEAAKALAAILETELIRLQCYEGLDLNSALYEWNYQKQLLGIKIQQGTDNAIEEKENYVFGSSFLLNRPLLQSILYEERAPVLLVDEIDRADEAFEAFLLELLAEFQITIPELGTIQARKAPHVILTSNSSRELSDALKRRCLYHWIDYPDLEKELEIVRARAPEAAAGLAREVAGLVQGLRGMDLYKVPGVAETLDWARSLAALGATRIDSTLVNATIGAGLKYQEDLERVREQVPALVEKARGA